MLADAYRANDGVARGDLSAAVYYAELAPRAVDLLGQLTALGTTDNVPAVGDEAGAFAGSGVSGQPMSPVALSKPAQSPPARA